MLPGLQFEYRLCSCGVCHAMNTNYAHAVHLRILFSITSKELFGKKTFHAVQLKTSKSILN